MHPREFIKKLKKIDRLWNIRHHSKTHRVGDGLYFGNKFFMTIPPGRIYPQRELDYMGMFDIPFRSVSEILNFMRKDRKITSSQYHAILTSK